MAHGTARGCVTCTVCWNVLRPRNATLVAYMTWAYPNGTGLQPDGSRGGCPWGGSALASASLIIPPYRAPPC